MTKNHFQHGFDPKMGLFSLFDADAPNRVGSGMRNVLAQF